jgi:hypothetical protein
VLKWLFAFLPHTSLWHCLNQWSGLNEHWACMYYTRSKLGMPTPSLPSPHLPCS